MYKVGEIVKNYKILLSMKRGSQGFVYLVEEVRSHEQCALKSLPMEESKKVDFEKMIEAWKTMGKSKSKDFIVSLKEHFYEDSTAIVIMEFCGGGDLETLMKKKALEGEKFTEQEVVKLLIEGARALDIMHFLKLIHRDIKPANFLIGVDGKYKMSDFNTSKILEGSFNTSTMIGTLEYTAAEIMNSEEYSFPVDMFSLGAVLYQMMGFCMYL